MNDLAKSELRAALLGIMRKHHLGFMAAILLLQALMDEFVQQGMPAAVAKQRQILISPTSKPPE